MTLMMAEATCRHVPVDKQQQPQQQQTLPSSCSEAQQSPALHQDVAAAWQQLQSGDKLYRPVHLLPSSAHTASCLTCSSDAVERLWLLKYMVCWFSMVGPVVGFKMPSEMLTTPQRHALQ